MARRGNSLHRGMPPTAAASCRVSPSWLALRAIPVISRCREQKTGGAFAMMTSPRSCSAEFTGPARRHDKGRGKKDEYLLLSSKSIRRRLARCGCGLDRLHHHCRCMPGRVIPGAPGMRNCSLPAVPPCIQIGHAQGDRRLRTSIEKPRFRRFPRSQQDPDTSQPCPASPT